MRFNELRKIARPLQLFHVWKMQFYQPCRGWGREPNVSEKIQIEGAEKFAGWLVENFKVTFESKEEKSGNE